jgi:hypothetical protein
MKAKLELIRGKYYITRGWFFKRCLSQTQDYWYLHDTYWPRNCSFATEKEALTRWHEYERSLSSDNNKTIRAL